MKQVTVTITKGAKTIKVSNQDPGYEKQIAKFLKQKTR